MYVVLDATVPFGDWGFRHWLDEWHPELRKTGVTLVIPRVVLDEHWGQIVRNFSDWWSRLPTEVVHLMGIQVPDLSPGKLTERIAEAKAKLTEDLEAEGIVVANYPPEDHEDVTARAIRRKRPFDSEGRVGYRDTLIWLTVLELCGNIDEQIVFITNDKSGFLADDGRSLHPDLAADLITRGFELERVVTYRNYVQFRRSHVDVELQAMNDVESQLKSGTFPFDLRTWADMAQLPRMTMEVEVTKAGGVGAVALEMDAISPSEVRSQGDQLHIYATALYSLLLIQAASRPLEIAKVEADVLVILDRNTVQVIEWAQGGVRSLSGSSAVQNLASQLWEKMMAASPAPPVNFAKAR